MVRQSDSSCAALEDGDHRNTEGLKGDKFNLGWSEPAELGVARVRDRHTLPRWTREAFGDSRTFTPHARGG